MSHQGMRRVVGTKPPAANLQNRWYYRVWGGNDYIAITNIKNFWNKDEGTMFALVRLFSMGSTALVLSLRQSTSNNCEIIWMSGNYFRVHRKANNVDVAIDDFASGAAENDGQWYLVGMTWSVSGGRLAAYVNGQPVGEVLGSLNAFVSVPSWNAFGISLDTLASDLNGGLAGGGFYTRPLSAPEMLALHTNGPDITDPTCVAAWSMNDEVGSTFVDMKGNVPGTGVGGSWYTDDNLLTVKANWPSP